MDNAHPMTHHPSPTITPVLIVGAGPTGLTLGIELARRGVPFRLIDRELEPPTTSRALGTQPRTVEVFGMMGIPERELQPATRPTGFQFREGARTLGRVAFSDPRGRPSLLVMDESDTQRVLEARLAQLGARVERGVELEAFRREEDGVVATLRDAGGATEVRARFLVGCDGANSVVRRDAGIDFVGGSYPERFLLADLELEWEISHELGTIWFGDEAGVVAAIPLPGDRRWRIIVGLGVGEAEGAHFTEAEAAALAEDELRRRAQIPLRRIGEPLWASAFHIHRKLADRYRAGPVFLAGDAAHVHSPVGGQGMNTGIQDAFNLGWKLALAARGQDPPGLLDSYEAERRPVARAVLRATDLGTKLVLGAHPVGRAIREYVFPTVTSLGPVRDRLQAALSELQVNYRSSPLSVDAAPVPRRRVLRRRSGIRAGDRVPDANLLDARTDHSVALFDCFARGWTMLLFPGAGHAAALPEVIRLIREMAGDAVQPYVVEGAAASSASIAPVLRDVTGEVARGFGAVDGMVAMVRPDGYLGFRGNAEQQGELASYLARIFAMRLREAARRGES
jgi:2-polyprenyl-6-methoxyphenol hydroxylase-like FAD-dependent oxidoreductase